MNDDKDRKAHLVSREPDLSGFGEVGSEEELLDRPEFDPGRFRRPRDWRSIAMSRPDRRFIPMIHLIASYMASI